MPFCGQAENSGLTIGKTSHIKVEHVLKIDDIRLCLCDFFFFFPYRCPSENLIAIYFAVKRPKSIGRDTQTRDYITFFAFFRERKNIKIKYCGYNG